MSSRFQLVPQEIASGLIEGVNFGPEIYVVARSPSAALIWVKAHSYSVNGRRSYVEGKLYALPDRTPMFTRRPRYKALQQGGRLSLMSLELPWREIAKLFGLHDPDVNFADANVLLRHVGDAIKGKQTLLIEGGVGQLMPAKRLGRAADEAWLRQPDRGWVTKAACSARDSALARLVSHCSRCLRDAIGAENCNHVHCPLKTKVAA
jgi:hypothetical protein